MFTFGRFRQPGGDLSPLRITLDELIDEDWNALAALVAERFPFGQVMGIPDGNRLALALEQFTSYDNKRVIVATEVLEDDEKLLTELKKLNNGDIGVTVFRTATGYSQYRIKVIFTRGM